MLSAYGSAAGSAKAELVYSTDGFSFGEKFLRLQDGSQRFTFQRMAEFLYRNSSHGNAFPGVRFGQEHLRIGGIAIEVPRWLCGERSGEGYNNKYTSGMCEHSSSSIENPFWTAYEEVATP
jgi:hypothetical protein